MAATLRNAVASRRPSRAVARGAVQRTALCTLAAGPHLELLEHALPGLEHLADRHGYELVVHRGLLAPGRPASWSKVVALHHLAGEFDRVVWVDSDAVVVDAAHDIARELPAGKDLGAVTHRYDGSEIPNLGVMVLRGGRRSRALLERMWACTDLVDHDWWENAALLRLLGYRLDEPVRRVHPTSAWRRFHELDTAWNAIPAVGHHAPRIVHLAGQPHHHRLSAMRRLAGVHRTADGSSAGAEVLRTSGR